MITKVFFEQVIPSFASPTDDLFLRMQMFFCIEEDNLKAKVGTFWNNAMENIVVKEAAQRTICLQAAYTALPHLDLVLTDTGFGVVSNPNVAPASAHRVEALKEAIRQQKSTARDLFFNHLLDLTEWGGTDEAAELVQNLVWSPSVARQLGMSMDGNHLIFDEEYQLLLPRILVAEAELQNLISPELYQTLVDNIAKRDKLPIPYLKIYQKARAFVAAKFNGDSMATVLMVHLLNQLNSCADSLTEYRNSATYRAHHNEPYKNKKEDGCFFFG